MPTHLVKPCLHLTGISICLVQLSIHLSLLFGSMSLGLQGGQRSQVQAGADSQGQCAASAESHMCLSTSTRTTSALYLVKSCLHLCCISGDFADVCLQLRLLLRGVLSGLQMDAQPEERGAVGQSCMRRLMLGLVALQPQVPPCHTLPSSLPRLRWPCPGGHQSEPWTRRGPPQTA